MESLYKEKLPSQLPSKGSRSGIYPLLTLAEGYSGDLNQRGPSLWVQLGKKEELL